MFTNVTHLLCGADFDEKDASEALDIYDIPSVTGEWVKASVRLGRLACPKTYHPMPGGLFQSIVAAVAQLNVNDRKKLYALITFHGGRVERNFTSKTTHLVCGIATGNIYAKAMEMKSEKFSVITPDWFYECLKAQEIIDAKPYHPRLLKPAMAPNSGSSSDSRSLSSILGLDDLKIDLKKNDSNQRAKPTISDTVMDTQPIKSVSTAAYTTVSSGSAITTTSALAAAATTTTLQSTTTNADDARSKADPTQTKPLDAVKPIPKMLTNQSTANQSKPFFDATNKERIVSRFVSMKLKSNGSNETIIIFLCLRFLFISGLAANTNYGATNTLVVIIIIIKTANAFDTSTNAATYSGTTNTHTTNTGPDAIPAKAARTTTQNGQSTSDYDAAAATTTISETSTKCKCRQCSPNAFRIHLNLGVLELPSFRFHFSNSK